jgi:PDZ domain-containing secreted protein
MLYREDVKEIYFTGMFTGEYNGLAVQYLDPETNSVRTYYPDFYIVYENGNEEIVEVKADFMIDDSNVNAKKLAAENLVKNSNLKYRLVKSSEVKSKSRIK